MALPTPHRLRHCLCLHASHCFLVFSPPFPLSLLHILSLPLSHSFLLCLSSLYSSALPTTTPGQKILLSMCVLCVFVRKGEGGLRGRACLRSCAFVCSGVHARACVSTCAHARARAHVVYACTSCNHPSTHRMRAAACGHACVRLLTHDVPLLHPPCFWTIEQISANRSSDSRSVQWQVSALLEPELGRGSMVRVTQGHWSAYPLHENQ